jgi:hypothetical protein
LPGCQTGADGLQRKAGLMKKAWELSVLCGADISIIIFNSAGKPFEFSSRDLDDEIDRYLEVNHLVLILFMYPTRTDGCPVV